MPGLETREKRESLLRAFYDEQPSLRRAPSSGPWEERLLSRGLPIVFPVTRRTKDGSYLDVVLIASDGTDFRRLCDEFRAFLGRSYCDETVGRLGKRIPFIHDHCGDDCYVSRLTVRDGLETAANGPLVRWCSVWSLRDGIAPQPVFQQGDELLAGARHRFHQALAAMDRDAANAALYFIEDKALLETTNRLYLRIQYHAAFREWEALLEDRNLVDVMHLARPAAVTEALLQAVYAVHLSPLAQDLPALVTKFRTDVFAAYRPLFRSRGTLCSTAVVRSFALRAVALEQERDRDTKSFHALLELPGLVPSDLEWLREVGEYSGVLARSVAAPATLPSPEHLQATAEVQAQGVSPETSQSSTSLSVGQAAEAFFREGFEDHARALLRMEPPGTEKAKQALRYARRDRTISARSLALETLNELPSPERRKFLSDTSVRALVGHMPAARPLDVVAPETPSSQPAGQARFPIPSAITPDADPEAPVRHAEHAADAEIPIDVLIPAALPDGWRAWAAMARQGDLPELLIVEAASDGVAEWSVQPLEVDGKAFANALDSLRDAPATRNLLLDTFPYLLRAFLEEPGYPRTAFAPIYSSLRWTLVYDVGHVTRTGLTLFYDLVAGQMAGGPSAAEYAAILEEMLACWEGGGANDALLLLDQLDILQDFTAPDPTRRAELARVAFSRVSGWLQSDRLAPDVSEYARRLAREYGLVDLLPTPYVSEHAESELATGTDWTKLKGKRVGIYTLMESAGNRLRSLITELEPACEVQLNSEKDGSAALEHLAKTADVLVIVTGCAKHAATEFIERHRPVTKPLLRPSGRGSSSVLSILSEHLQDVVSTGRPVIFGPAGERQSQATRRSPRR
jgi:hypothetical protein